MIDRQIIDNLCFEYIFAISMQASAPPPHHHHLDDNHPQPYASDEQIRRMLGHWLWNSAKSREAGTLQSVLFPLLRRLEPSENCWWLKRLAHVTFAIGFNATERIHFLFNMLFCGIVCVCVPTRIRVLLSFAFQPIIIDMNFWRPVKVAEFHGIFKQIPENSIDNCAWHYATTTLTQLSGLIDIRKPIINRTAARPSFHSMHCTHFEAHGSHSNNSQQK